MAALPELRKDSPEAVRKYLVEQAARIGTTGDALTDGIVQQKLAEQWGPMLSTHLKQHVAWLQEDTGNKFVELQAANGKLLQETLAQQEGYDDIRRQQETDKFVAGLARPPGMSEPAYGQYLTAAAKVQLHNGQFAAYEAMKADEAVWQAIPSEARQALIDSEALWAQRALRDAPALTAITTDEAHFKLAVSQGRFDSETQVHATIDQFNANFKEQSGSATDMINNTERAALVAQYHRAREAQASSWAQAQAGKLNDYNQQAATLAAINSGDPSRLPPGISEENARLAVEAFWRDALASPEAGTLDNALAKLALVSWEGKLRVPSLQAQLRQDATALFAVGGAITERQRASLTLMQKLATTPTGPAALSAYIGPEAALKVQAFLGSGVDLDDEKSLVEFRKLFKDGAGAHTTQDDIESARRYIEAQDQGWFTRNLNPFSDTGALNEYELTAPTLRRLAQDLAPLVARAKRTWPGLDDDAAAQYAFNLTTGNPETTDFVDGTLVPRNPHARGVQSLYAGVRQVAGVPISQADETYQAAVRGTLRGTLREHVAAQVRKLNDDGLPDAGREHEADLSRYRDEDYEAIGGEQLAGGRLMVTYHHKETRRPVAVIIEPQQVWEQYKQHLVRKTERYEDLKPRLIELPGGAALVYRKDAQDRPQVGE